MLLTFSPPLNHDQPTTASHPHCEKRPFAYRSPPSFKHHRLFTTTFNHFSILARCRAIAGQVCLRLLMVGSFARIRATVQFRLQRAPQNRSGRVQSSHTGPNSAAGRAIVIQTRRLLFRPPIDIARRRHNHCIVTVARSHSLRLPAVASNVTFLR